MSMDLRMDFNQEHSGEQNVLLTSFKKAQVLNDCKIHRSLLKLAMSLYVHLMLSFAFDWKILQQNVLESD